MFRVGLSRQRAHAALFKLLWELVNDSHAQAIGHVQNRFDDSSFNREAALE